MVAEEDEIIKTVKKFLNAVNEQGVRVDRAFLFGSRARGDEREESDIDLALVSDKFTGNRIDDSEGFGKYIWKIDTRIETVTFRPEDFNENDPLAYFIINEGMEINLIETEGVK